jgi:hypothetical protein
MAKLTIRLSDGIYRQLRIRCVERGMKIQNAVAGAIMDWLDPESVTPQNPAYVYDPDSEYIARAKRGESREQAIASVKRECLSRGIDGWDSPFCGTSRPPMTEEESEVIDDEEERRRSSIANGTIDTGETIN